MSLLWLNKFRFGTAFCHLWLKMIKEKKMLKLNPKIREKIYKYFLKKFKKLNYFCVYNFDIK